MASVTNVKTVRFKSENQMGYGDDLYAHDVGQILRFTGITLPGLYRVYFSRFPEGEGVIRLGDENGVTVPSECLTYPGPLYVWIVLTHAEKDKTTTYKALLQVLARSDVPDVPDEESGSVITDAINAMNDVMGRVERAEDVLNRAETVVSGIESYPSVTYYECSQLRKVSTVVPVADIDNPLYPSPGLSSQYADGVGLVIPLQSGYTPKENDLFMIKATDDILLPEQTNNRKYSALYISFLIVEHTDDGGIRQHEEPRLIYNIPYNYPAGTRMFDKNRVYIFRYRPHTASDPYQQDTSYGTGFDVLNYMVGVKEAAEKAKEVMDEAVSIVTEKAVRYDERQTLTEEQQVMARSNIHAAMLDANGRVPASQLPSYVDDVLEGYVDPHQDPITTFYRVRMGEAGNYSYSEPYTPEAGKIYVDMATNLTYRWSGSIYAEISQSLALGETSSTAFPGDRGKKTEDDLNAMVKVQETQPVEDANKIWIDETGDDEVTVPTIQEFHSLIKVQDQQPTEADNRLWIDETATDEVQVVTVDDFNALDNRKINKPSTNPNGTSGQILRSNGDGSTTWSEAATAEEVASATTAWLNEHISGGQTIAIDDSLSVAGAAADAKKTGDEISDLKSATTNHIVSDEIKTALLACIQEVAWATDNGRELYDALFFALNPPANLISISAIFTQTRTIYTNDNLSVLRSGLSVTAHYSDETETVIHAYTLFGTLTEGASAVTVAYGGKTTTFSVAVTDATLLYNLPESTVFDGSNSSLIDTNVTLFPEDRDLTIVIDMQSDTSHNNDWICWCGTISSPYRGLSVRYRNNSYGTGYTALTTGEAPVPSSYRDGMRNKFVVRKRNGSVAQIMCYNSDVGLSSANASANNVVAPSSKLWIGGVDGNSSSFEQYNFKGTIYEFKVYTRYFEDEEAYAYLDAGVNA